MKIGTLFTDGDRIYVLAALSHSVNKVGTVGLLNIRTGRTEAETSVDDTSSITPYEFDNLTVLRPNLRVVSEIRVQRRRTTSFKLKAGKTFLHSYEKDGRQVDDIYVVARYSGGLWSLIDIFDGQRWSAQVKKAGRTPSFSPEEANAIFGGERNLFAPVSVKLEALK